MQGGDARPSPNACMIRCGIDTEQRGMRVARSSDKMKRAEKPDNDAQQCSFPMFKKTLAYQAQLLARITQADYLERIRMTGIAPAQAYVLGELWLEEPLSQVELSRRLEIGKATIGQTLQRLEKAGIIERRRVAADRRLVMVHLTAKGQTLHQPLKIGAVEQDELLARKLGSARIAMLTDLLEESNRLLSGSLPIDAERTEILE